MDKRTLFALVLIFAIFWLSNELIWKKKTPVQQEPGITTTETVQQGDPFQDVEPSATGTVRRAATDQIPDQYREMFAGEEISINDNIRLENDQMLLVFSNQGGLLKTVYLKEHYHYDKLNPVNLIPEEGSLFNLQVETQDDLLQLDDYVFNWEITTRGEQRSLSFYLGDQDRRLIEKSFVINDGYGLTGSIVVSGMGAIRDYTLGFGSGIAETEESVKQKEADFRFIGQIQNSLTNIPLRRIKESTRIAGNVDWVSIRSKYFIMILIPEQRLQTDNVNVFKSNDSPAFEITVNPGRAISEVNDRFEIYLGPLDYKLLQSYGLGLEETIDMGWKVIRPLGRLFLWLLTTMNKLFANYGVTIIFFALILKIVLSPLTHKSFESSHKMQKMSPHMQEIQRKYKSDPKQMQVELQKLYKEHGVNPLGGCFPLLLQMPVFFALYPVLRNSIELRQASFMFWLTDLSEPDPYLILPILMGIFMFVQQKMMMPKNINKEQMDEKQLAQMQSQRMMMYIMPVFLVFIFRTLPAGLVLYWTVFNIFSIIQQYYIVKKFNR